MHISKVVGTCLAASRSFYKSMGGTQLKSGERQVITQNALHFNWGLQLFSSTVTVSGLRAFAVHIVTRHAGNTWGLTGLVVPPFNLYPRGIGSGKMPYVLLPNLSWSISA